jgi:starch phosphorylase
MVSEYNQQLYLPALAHYRLMQADNYRRARELAAWKKRVREAWPSLKIERVEDDCDYYLLAGGSLTVRALVDLGSLQPDEVVLDIYHGKVDAWEKIAGGGKTLMAVEQKIDGGKYLYSGKIQGIRSGRQGYTLRLRPWHRDLAPNSLPELVLWG